MPRPRKCRKVCQVPHIKEFQPVGALENAAVILTVDEYETIRLIDKQGFSQEECSAYMKVARTTVQLIYNSARKKLAEALTEGRALRIEGGDYELCDGKEVYCGCGGCRKHRMGSRDFVSKEGESMKVAIPLDENQRDVCIVLARAPFFLMIEDGVESIIENPAAQAQGGAGIQVAQFLVDHKVDVLITVRCGQNAAEVFKMADMKVYKSVHKTATEDFAGWKEGKLKELTEFHGGFHGTL